MKSVHMSKLLRKGQATIRFRTCPILRYRTRFGCILMIEFSLPFTRAVFEFNHQLENAFQKFKLMDPEEWVQTVRMPQIGQKYYT